MASKLSIIVPVYNERDTIESVLEKIKRADTGPIQKEIILVDDGSTDGSREILARLVGEGVKVFYNETNLGKGGAVKRGFKEASGEVVIIQDADLEYDPKDYLSVVGPVFEGKSDVVLGVRKLDLDLSPMGILHRLGNIAITLVTNILYLQSAEEYTGGYKVFRKEILDTVSVKGSKFDFEHELICKLLKKGYVISTVPISYSRRGEGKKLSWKDGFRILWSVIKFRFVD